ncbi:alanine dehydrogenase [bacterium]|nr:alanine dehydrogenase [bacterium]
MIIAVPKEIKPDEYRVGLTPSTVSPFVKRGHRVLIEPGAGVGSGFTDAEYQQAGAQLVTDRAQLFGEAEMVVKVKEPLADELDLLREGQILYTYLHLAADPQLTQALLRKKVVGVAYETIALDDGSLPLLTPMSEIAGRLAVQEGAKYLEKPMGGRGILLGGVPGIPRGEIVILGGGVVGLNACKIAIGLGANVTVLDISHKRLAYLDDIFACQVTTLYSNENNIRRCLERADVVIGGVLIPGATAPKLVRRQDLALMRRGAVVVDVAVDQGGCFESTRPTTHHDPVYVEEEVVHYAVANMPGAVALSSTIALTSVTYTYGLLIADRGIEAALRESTPLCRGVNVYRGACTHQGVADSLNLPYTDLATVL